MPGLTQAPHQRLPIPLTMTYLSVSTVSENSKPLAKPAWYNEQRCCRI